MTKSLQQTILVIDDEQMIRNCIRLFLENHDYKVLEAKNGSEGLEIYERKSPDMVLVDLRMPGIKGLEVIATIHKKSPDLPVIVVSGTGMIGNAIEAIHEGAWDYILKPIQDMSILLHAINKAFERQKLIRENRQYQQHLEELVEQRTADLEIEIQERKEAELAVQKSEEKLQLALEVAEAVSWEMDFRIESCTYIERWAKRLGYNPGEIPSTIKGVESIIHPEDIPTNHEKLNACVTGAEKIYETECRLKKKNGEWIWVLSRGKIVEWDEKNNPVRLMGTNVDITNRKQIEIALQESTTFNSQMIESARDGIVVYGPDLRYKVWNPFMEELSGKSANEVLGKHPIEVFPVLKDVGILERLEKILEGKSFVEEIDFYFKVPKEGWASDISAPLKNAKGEIIGIMGIVRSITDRKLAENKLRESEEKYRLLSENMLDMVALHELDATYLFISPSVETLLGYTPEELIGTSPYDLFHPEDKERIRNESHNRAHKGEITTLIEYRIRKKDGTYIWFASNSRPIYDEKQNIIQLQTISRDITEKKEYELNLLERNTYIQTIIDNLPIGLATNFIDSGKANYVNKKFEEIYGWPAEDMKDIPHFFERVYPDPAYRESLMTRVMEDIQSGDATRMHWDNLRITRKDGSKGIITAKNIPLFDQNIMISTVQDITEIKNAEEALISHKNLLSVIAENYPHSFISIIEKDLTVSFSSGQEFKKQNLNPEDYTGKTLDEIFGDDVDDVKTHYMKTFQGEETSFEMELFGQYQQYNTVPLYDENGNIPQILAVVENITERKEFEMALEKSRQEWENIFQAIGHPSLILDSNHQIIDANRATLDLVDATMDSLRGKRCYEVFHNMGNPPEHCPLKSLIEQNAVVPFEMMMEAVGKIFWVSCTPVLDDQGNIEKVIHIATDITERIEAENALKESEALYRHLFEAESDALFLVENKTGEILAANQAACILYGYDHQAMLSKKNTDLSAEPDETRLITETTPVIEENIIKIALRYHQKKDGTVFPVEVTGRFFEWQGKEVHIAAVRDITERLESQEKLRYEHDLWEHITETSPIGITQVDKDGQITFANSRAEEILHLKKNEITQRDYNAPEWLITDYEGGPYPEKNLPFNLVKKNKKSVFNIQHAIQWPDGKRRYLSINAAPLFDENEKFESMVAAIEDITEFIESEKEKEQHRQKYEQLFNTMIDGYALHEIILDKNGNPSDYRYIDVNPAFEQMTGLKRKTIIGKTVLKVMPHTEKYWIETFGNVAITGKPIQLENYSGALKKYFEVTAFSPQMNQFVAIFIDITERKITELALKENRRILLESQKVSQIGHYNFKIQTGFWECSEVLDEIFGIDDKFNKTIEGWLTIVHPDFMEEMQDHLHNHVIKKHNQFDKEYKIIRSDNHEERWVHGLGRLEFNKNDEPVQMIGTIQDITKTKLVQMEREKLIHELETKNAELERFTYTVSHDLKSPIVTIQGFIGILTQDIKSGKYDQLKKYTDFISDAAKQMEHLLKDLLELSRIGRVVNPSLTISMNEIIRNTRNLLNENIKQKKVKIKVQPNMPSVYVDSVRIQEVMNNLVENAIKFSGENTKPLIEIGCKRLKTEYQFIVKDNGIGIEPKYHKKIFGLFDQLDKEFEGTGVGLSLVKRIIEFHGGRIWVESEGKNKGTTFCFTLPKLKS